MVDRSGQALDATSVPLEDFLAIGLALWARSLQHPGQVIAFGDLSSFRGDSERIEAAVSLFAAEPGALASSLERQEKQFGFQWSFDAASIPPHRIPTDSLLVLSHTCSSDESTGGCRSLT